MKFNIFYCVLIASILTSCSNSDIVGKYVRIKSNGRGGSLGILTEGKISEIEFKDKNCNFSYFGIPMSGKYEIDKNYIYIHTTGELGTLALEKLNDGTLEGEGWISGTFKK